MAEGRKKLTYANLMSTIAVVLALGGGTAYAATQINGHSIRSHTISGSKLVNNTLTGKQIKESTLGAVPTAHSLAPLASGKSESGTWAGDGGDTSGDWIGWEASFPQPLAAAIPADKVLWDVNGADPNCTGPGHAAPGYLCLYDVENSAVTWYGSRDDLLPAGPAYGAIGWFRSTGAGNYVAFSWTVTAP